MTPAGAHASAGPPVACLLCGTETASSIDATDYITSRRFVVRRCPACGFGRTAAVPAALDDYYPRRYRQYSGVTRAVLKTIYGWKVRTWSRSRRPGLAVEVGCGEGWMLAALRQRGWRVIGNERSLDSARAAAAANQLPMFVGTLGAVRPAPRVRMLILFQALEHLSDVLSTLREGAGMLDDTGAIVVAVPNLASWQARLFGRFWFHLDVPRHVNHFSPQSLQLAFSRAGLRVERVRFVSFEHDPYGWIQSTLNALGFKQNLLTKWIMGMQDEAATPPTLALMIAISLLLALPSVVLSVVSWALGAGALVEVWGRKA